MSKYSTLTLLILLLAISSCKKKTEDNNCDESLSFDRKEMVSQLTTQYIAPAYNDYYKKANGLVGAVTAFAQNTTLDNLLACRSTWQSTAIAWQSVAFLEIGPAENIGLRSQTNIYPTDTVQVQNNISAGTYDLAMPSNYVAKGIQCLDFLLHMPNHSDYDIVDYYTSIPNAKQYLIDVATELENNASLVKTEWQNYSTTFIDNTSDNAQGSAVSNMVNALSAHYETFVRKGKVGIPVGIFNGFSQTPMPYHSEAYYSNFSNQLLLAQLKALKRFMNGNGLTSDDNGLGFDDYMDFVEAKKGSDDLSIAINNQIDAVITNVENLSTTLSIAVTAEPEQSKALYTSMQKLVPLIKVDLTSALGVLVTYQDNDGD